MILTKNIFFKNFLKKTNTKKASIALKDTLQNKTEVLRSLTTDYDYSYSKKKVNKLKNKISTVNLIGMGGSILGTKAIYKFLKHKIKKKVLFYDNLIPKVKNIYKTKKSLNLIVSKSGNTLETISNTNVLIKKKDNNIFLVQNDENYLKKLAERMRADVIDHNNFIGGRYSVLSEVGMLPASLIGLQERKFKQFNYLVKNKKFMNSLISNVSSIIFYLKKKKFNSIILNYDESSDDFFRWYQQLVGESLGKKQKGIFPYISTMPKDNHSLMQLYLDGPKNSFFTFFNVKDKISNKIKNQSLLDSQKFLKNKSFSQILNAQRLSTEKVFRLKKIPFRSFQILNKNEEVLGELFSFFILETILLGKLLKINPYDQPAVETIKINTKKILKSY